MNAQELIAAGFAALGRESYKEAAEFARAALAQAPDDPGALTLLGRLALAACKPEIALAIFEKLARPDAPPATWLDLSRTFLDLRREADALEAVQYAAKRAPQSAEAWFLLGEVATMLDDLPLAQQALEKVLEIDPKQTEALARLSRIAPASADRFAASERRLKAGGLSPSDASNLHYALANFSKGLKRRREYISHLLAANAAQRAAFDGPMPDLKASNERLMAIYSKQAFAQSAIATASLPTPIFIVGMPRTGTTLVEQIVTGVDGVESAGELKFYRDVLPADMEAMTGKRFPEGFERLSSIQLDQLAAPLNGLFRAIGRGAQYVTDKSLDNFQRVGLLLHLFPNARIVCLRRDPMDTCFSILQQQFAASIVQTFDIDLMAQASKRFADIMDHWRSMFGGRFLEVQYERLVSEPEPEARRIITYCGLQWDDALLEFHKRDGAVRTFSDQQVRKPIHNSSIGAWREFAEDLKPLRRALEAQGVPFAR